MSHPPRGSCVLIVEDEYFIADDLRRLLVEQGYDVAGPVASSAAAWGKIDDHAVDFVVLDVNLEGSADFELAAGLHEAEIPFLFLTGYDRTMIPAQLRDVAFFQKPHEPTAIVETIARRLNERAES